jgi:hypothetical protein
VFKLGKARYKLRMGIFIEKMTLLGQLLVNNLTRMML